MGLCVIHLFECPVRTRKNNAAAGLTDAASRRITQCTAWGVQVCGAERRCSEDNILCGYASVRVGRDRGWRFRKAIGTQTICKRILYCESASIDTLVARGTGCNTESLAIRCYNWLLEEFSPHYRSGFDFHQKWDNKSCTDTGDVK